MLLGLTRKDTALFAYKPAVRGDLIRIMRKLLKRPQKLDGIIVETTGLANPGPVIQTFFVDDNIKVGAAWALCGL